MGIPPIRLIVIILCKGEEPPPLDLLKEINHAFMEKYAEFLEDYSKSDLIAFKDFSQNVKKFLETYLYEEPDKDLEIQITALLEEKEPPKPKLKPIRPPEPKYKSELIKTVEFKSIILKQDPKLEPKLDAKPIIKLKSKKKSKFEQRDIKQEDIPDIFKPPALRSKKEPIIFPKIIREETSTAPEEFAKKVDLKQLVFNNKANNIQLAQGYCLNFVDFNEAYSIAMEAWAVPEIVPDKLLKVEQLIKKKLKASSLIRALFISSNPTHPSIYKLWLKIGKIKKNKVRESLTQGYLFFVESNINEKLTYLCWTSDNKDFVILRELNDDPLHLQVLFETTDRVTEWNFK